MSSILSEKKIGIIDAVLICNQCGQKIKLKHLKCQMEKREKLISEFKKIGDRIVMQIRATYGRTSKGSEYLENLFKEEFKTLEETKP